MGRIVHLSDVPETATPSGRWQPLNDRLGIRNFGVNAVVMDPGEALDIEHDEAGDAHQEVYVVVSGRAAFRLGDTEVEAGPGDVVAVPDPGETRDYRALEPGTRIICFGAGPGAEHPYGEWIAREAAGG
jgi:mannose-6-phosphate isomerase-like protein (cupin superfamily)